MEYINTTNVQKRGRLRLILSMPFIYGVFIPILLLDISISLYQAICFPLYGIQKVDRKKYIRDQRWKLPYLNGLEKLNCYYCGYANGFAMYFQAILKATEKMWCPIKNKKIPGIVEPPYRKEYAEYKKEEELVKYLDTSTHVRPVKK